MSDQKYILTPTHVTVVMTHAEWIGLERLAGEGAEGLFNDDAAGAAYLGSPGEREAAARARRLAFNISGAILRLRAEKRA